MKTDHRIRERRKQDVEVESHLISRSLVLVRAAFVCQKSADCHTSRRALDLLCGAGLMPRRGHLFSMLYISLDQGASSITRPTSASVL